jgi:hypothetical protein
MDKFSNRSYIRCDAFYYAEKAHSELKVINEDSPTIHCSTAHLN